MATLITERLILRPIVNSDLDLIFKYARNPNIGPKAGWSPHKDKQETKKIMNDLFLGKDSVWAITLIGDDSFRGVIGLENDPKRSNKHVRMLGYWLNEDDWGKGYMTEAATEVVRYGFEDLGLPLISSNCFSFNESSRNVIEKTGLKFEGILRQAEERFDGEVFDLRMYSLTGDEYLTGV